MPEEFSSPLEAYRYARIIHKRCPEAEPTIVQDPNIGDQYAHMLIVNDPAGYHSFIAQYGRPTSLREPIAQELYDAWYAFTYARDKVHGRWPAGESTISKDPDIWGRYTDMMSISDPEGYEAFQLEHGDWVPSKVAESPEDDEPPSDYTAITGETPDPIGIAAYRAYVQVAAEGNKRRPDLEPAIRASRIWRQAYENLIRQFDPPGFSSYRRQHGYKFREPTPMEKSDAYYAFCYASGVVQGRFPAGEDAIIADRDHIEAYQRLLRKYDPEGYAEFELERGAWAPSKVAEAALAKARRAHA